MDATRRINPFRMFSGSWLPSWLLERPEVSPGAKLVYARLARFAGKRGVAFPRQATLAREVGLRERQVRTYLAELRELKLIECARGGRAAGGASKVARYYFLAHLWITSGAFLDRQDAAGPNGLDRQDAAGPKTRPTKDARARPEESHRRGSESPAGGAACGRGPAFMSKGNPKNQARVAGLLAGIGSSTRR